MNQPLNGGWRIVESDFALPEDNEAYFFFNDSTMISAWVMDGVGLVPIGEEVKYSYNNNLLVKGAGAKSGDSIRTVFIGDSKLLLMWPHHRDTMFLIRESIED